MDIQVKRTDTAQVAFSTSEINAILLREAKSRIEAMMNDGKPLEGFAYSTTLKSGDNLIKLGGTSKLILEVDKIRYIDG